MNSENDLRARVQEDLRTAGYPLVLTEMPLPTMRKQRLDVVAFAADKTGALQPVVVVEVRRSKIADTQLVLDQLALVRDVLGTRRHYLVTPDGWSEADPGLRRLEHVDGPADPERPGGELRDVSTVELLMQQSLWIEGGRHCTKSEPNGTFRAVRDMLGQFTGSTAVLADQIVPMNPTTRWHAVRDVVRQYLVRDKHLEPLLSQPPLARPLAQLLGNALPAVIEDPFAGLGGFLWAVADRAMEGGASVDLSGTDFNADVVELASAVGALCPTPLRFRVSDSFRACDEELVDAVITQPPLGLRLSNSFPLSSGASTRDGEIAAIDVAVNRLKPGGRAVLHMSRGWTWRGGDAARYRAYLASTWRVGALIGLPAGVYAGTHIPSIIVIIDRAAPGDTFVAHLEANWAEELAPGGTVLTECLEHLDAPRTEVSIGDQDA